MVSRHGVLGRNENEDKMIRLHVERNLMVGNTLFTKKKNSQIYMDEKRQWKDRAMMDHVVVSRSVMGRSLDVSFERGRGRYVCPTSSLWRES